MEVRKQMLPKKLIREEEERQREEKQNREKAVQPLALGAVNGAAKGVAATRQWQMVNRSDKPKAAIPKAVEPVVQPVKVQKKAAPQPNPMSAYDPLVKIAKSLPTISPAHQLAQKPVFNNRDGAKLYDALSRQLDAQGMAAIDSYYAGQVGTRLKARGVQNPSNALTQGLAQAWMGRRPEGERWNAVMNYPLSGAVLEELLALRPGLGNMSPGDLNRMINDQYRQTLDEKLSPEDRARAMNRLGIYEKEALVNRGMTAEEVEAIKAGKRSAGAEPLKMAADEEPDIDLRKQLSEQPQDESIEQMMEEMESALSDYDREQGIKVVEVEGNVYYDYTEPINQLLEQSLGEFKTHDVKGAPLKDYKTILDKLLWFRAQVDNGMPWDLKVDEPWKQQFGELRMPAFGDEFYFRGEKITRENLGNLTYGYLGSVMGVPPDFLYGMGGAANKVATDPQNRSLVYWFNEAMKAGEEKEYLDGPNDYPFVKLGVAMYQEDFETE